MRVEPWLLLGLSMTIVKQRQAWCTGQPVFIAG
jgi:hypothetical protein